MPSEVSWNRLRQHPLPVGSVVGVRLALYFRISTADQNSELQQRDLRADASSRGEIVETYQDVASGSTTARPGLTRLLADAKAGKFDCVLVWKLDRFGRSLVDCLNNIRTLDENGIRLIAVTQSLDTDRKNPASRFLVHVLGAAAEFERELIRERTQAGRLRYQQDFDNGKVGKTVQSRSGKNFPPHRPRKIFDRERVIELRRQGLSLRQIAKRERLGLGTVVRTLRERSKSS
jgi:putative DNA-invertase from lambdoid prophage Rac